MDADTASDERDLILSREVPIEAALIWRAWTEPNLLMQWFCPRPWGVSKCHIDLRPGGAFHTTMRSPEGDEFPSTGCYLEVSPGKRLVWTSALGPEYQPVPEDPDGFHFTGFLLLEPTAEGTRYTAIARHATAAAAQKHAAMGFHDGWGAALDQLVALMTTGSVA